MLTRTAEFTRLIDLVHISGTQAPKYPVKHFEAKAYHIGATGVHGPAG